MHRVHDAWNRGSIFPRRPAVSPVAREVPDRPPRLLAVKIANQTCEVIPGGVDNPNITLIMSDKNWLAIAEGKLDAMNAYMTGKVKVTGDMMLAMRIPQLFPVKR